MGIFLELPENNYGALWRHLIRPDPTGEEVAFVYARLNRTPGSTILSFIDWFPVSPEGFASRSEYHLELTDEVRTSVIKRAHDLGASIVEFHFHSGPWAARFSKSDLHGLREFVPHVWWRLKGRPYLAVVVSSSDFDALVWLKDPNTPERLNGLRINSHVLTPTGLTPLIWED